MPVELHERLSEFSYGYGVTREVEQQLRREGLRATPFMPSLLHEAKLGFDVAFDRRGTPLMLQFKLGQAMRRFVPAPRPSLQQPFWRYHIDTAEPEGQFELLFKAEQDGADVFYIAPKFHDWEMYLEAFERRHVVRSSLIVRPGDIRATLVANNVPDGRHKIVYDRERAYVCSEPLALAPLGPADLGSKVQARVESRTTSLGDVLEEVFKGFENRATIRRPSAVERQPESERISFRIASDEGRQPLLRRERLQRLLSSGRDREEAIALLVGAEAWSSGAQLIYVTESLST